MYSSVSTALLSSAVVLSLSVPALTSPVWLPFGRSEFMLVDKPVAHQGAKTAMCRIQTDKNAILATVTGVAEELFLFQQISDGGHAWVSSLDAVETADGTEEECVMVGSNDMSTQYFEKCTNANKYICERPFSPTNYTDPLAGMAYIYVSSPQPWDTARSVCQSFGAGGDLAPITSVASEVFVKGIAAQHWEWQSSNAPWIGGSDQWSLDVPNAERTFEWARIGGDCTSGTTFAPAAALPAGAGQPSCVAISSEPTCYDEVDTDECKEYVAGRCSATPSSCPALCKACSADGVSSTNAMYSVASCRAAKPFICAVPLKGGRRGGEGGGGAKDGGEGGDASEDARDDADGDIPADNGTIGVLPSEKQEGTPSTTNAAQTTTTSNSSRSSSGGSNEDVCANSNNGGLKAAVVVLVVFAVAGAIAAIYFRGKLAAVESKLQQELVKNETHAASDQRIGMEQNPMHSGPAPIARAPMPAPRIIVRALEQPNAVVQNELYNAPASPTRETSINVEGTYVLSDPNQPQVYDDLKSSGVVQTNGRHRLGTYLAPDSRQPAVYDNNVGVNIGSGGYQPVEYVVVDGSNA